MMTYGVFILLFVILMAGVVLVLRANDGRHPSSPDGYLDSAAGGRQCPHCGHARNALAQFCGYCGLCV